MSIRYCLLSMLLGTFLLFTESHMRPEVANEDEEMRELSRGLGERESSVTEGDTLDDETDPEGFRWLGLGVLSNMQQFFDNLKENLDALETLPAEEKESLLSTSSQLPSAELRRISPPRRLRNGDYGRTSCRCRQEDNEENYVEENELRLLDGLPPAKSTIAKDRRRRLFGRVDKDGCFHATPSSSTSERVNSSRNTWIDERERHRDRAYRPSATAAYLNALRTHHPSYKIRNFVESPEPVSYRGTNRYDPSLMWTGLGRRKR